MKRSIKFMTVFVFMAIFCMASCAGKPINVGDLDEQPEVSAIELKKRTLSASASGFQLLLLIPININDRHERAYEILRGQAGSDYITDIKIKESWTYALVGTVYTTTIEATAYPR